MLTKIEIRLFFFIFAKNENNCPMKRLTLQLLFTLALLVPMTACSNHTAAIEALVEELNSPAFRAQEAKTGLFDDSKAEISGDQLIITFLCRPYINLAQIDQNQLPALENSATDEFRANISADENFRKGMEALRHEKMTLLLVWQDANGASIKIPIDPAKILPETGN